MITINQYFTELTSGKDRRKLFPKEFKPEYEKNAEILLQKVNSLLNALGIKDVKVSSGWRPDSLNKQISNAAKASLHRIGSAVDILDNDSQDIGNLVANHPDLLRKYGLFVEDLNSTKGKNSNWCHIDCGSRADRPSRMFKP